MRGSTRTVGQGVFLFVALSFPVIAWSQETAPARSHAKGASARVKKARFKDDRKGTRDSKTSLYEDILDDLRAAHDAAEIRRHMQKLSDGFPDARDVLASGARRGSARVRALAIKLFGDHGDAETDLDVVAAGLGDGVPAVRMAAVMALRRLGNGGFQPTVRHLRTETEPNIRKMSIMNLGIWRNRDAIPVLARGLASEADRGVRKYTVRALESLSGERFGDDPEAWTSYAEEYEYRKNQDRVLAYSRAVHERAMKRERAAEKRLRESAAKGEAE